jgi:N-acetylglutamate synthase-like GNAT family acetyltransferase
MNIREALISDCDRIQNLLEQLGYDETQNFLSENLNRLLTDPKETFLVCEMEQQVVAFISVHFIPQIGRKGDFARISYFSVDSNFTGRGIGSRMEEYVARLAQEKGCDRLEVHCQSFRSDAHRFYLTKGFTESPKYFMKKLP